MENENLDNFENGSDIDWVDIGFLDTPGIVPGIGLFGSYTVSNTKFYDKDGNLIDEQTAKTKSGGIGGFLGMFF